jgi:hypothetical protein
VHGIWTDLDGSEQRVTCRLAMLSICCVYQVKNCQSPVSHDSSTQRLISPCDDPRQHTRMEHGIAPERVVEVALPLLDLESNV